MAATRFAVPLGLAASQSILGSMLLTRFSALPQTINNGGAPVGPCLRSIHRSRSCRTQFRLQRSEKCHRWPCPFAAQPQSGCDVSARGIRPAIGWKRVVWLCRLQRLESRCSRLCSLRQTMKDDANKLAKCMTELTDLVTELLRCQAATNKLLVRLRARSAENEATAVTGGGSSAPAERGEP